MELSMEKKDVHFFKDSRSAYSKFNNAELSYEKGGDIEYDSTKYLNKYNGFVCFIPSDKSQIDLYAFENFTD